MVTVTVTLTAPLKENCTAGAHHSANGHHSTGGALLPRRAPRALGGPAKPFKAAFDRKKKRNPSQKLDFLGSGALQGRLGQKKTPKPYQKIGFFLFQTLQGPGPGTSGPGPGAGTSGPGPVDRDQWTGPRARDQWTGPRARDQWFYSFSHSPLKSHRS